jgi:hypothetical protein
LSIWLLLVGVGVVMVKLARQGQEMAVVVAQEALERELAFP